MVRFGLMKKRQKKTVIHQDCVVLYLWKMTSVANCKATSASAGHLIHNTFLNHAETECEVDGDAGMGYNNNNREK